MFEQRPADAAFGLLDGVADPGRGHVQALGRPAEAQLLGQHQKDLDVSKLHGPPDREPDGHRCVGTTRIDDRPGNAVLPTSPLFGGGPDARLLTGACALRAARRWSELPGKEWT
ncbi:hypothetical protein [Actinomadura kijaniata]|uniref:hypothetical protein n=1 Tax=Actinomadura kijaniata TaxID=46161 RepID=UPI00350E45E0